MSYQLFCPFDRTGCRRARGPQHAARRGWRMPSHLSSSPIDKALPRCLPWPLQLCTSRLSLSWTATSRPGSMRSQSSPNRIAFIGATAARRSFKPCERELIAAKEICCRSTRRASRAASCQRSNPSDVARVEHLTFVCTQNREDAGPNNHWMAPEQAHAQMDALFAGCMKGRTMYVVPYCMGPIDSPFSRCGVEITDSAYVVLNMQLMTRMGRAALERIARDGKFVRGLHSTGRARPEPALHHAFPRRALHQELRLGLRRQCPARQEVPCAAHRELAGAHRGLARGAHAHRRHRKSAGRDPLSGLRVSLRLRQDQSRDVDPAGRLQGLESLDGGRRHRLAAPGQGRQAVRDQSRVGLFRRGARHQCQDQSQRLRDDSPRHDFHQRRA